MLGAPLVRRLESAKVVLLEIGMIGPRPLLASNYCAVHATTGCEYCMGSNYSSKPTADAPA